VNTARTSRLDADQLRLLRLARKGALADGWAPVSKLVFPLLANVPVELLEREQSADGSGRCRLTVDGRIVLTWA
jgi:hypothetical protein